MQRISEQVGDLQVAGGKSSTQGLAPPEAASTLTSPARRIALPARHKPGTYSHPRTRAEPFTAWMKPLPQVTLLSL